MKRGGGYVFAAGCFLFFLSGISSPRIFILQESAAETATSTASDFFLPTPFETETAGPSDTDTLSFTDTPGEVFTPTWSPTESFLPADSPSESPTATESPTDTCEATATATESPTGTASPTQDDSPPQVVISEVAWAGTAASPNDEWIELWNAGGTADLAGWVLTDNGDIRIYLSGTIGSGGFFLLERTDDSTVGNIPADQIYTGALSNSGEALFLMDASGSLVDSANGDGGPWPAGAAVPYGTMERASAGSASDSAWCANDSVHRSGSDANGNPINGTPRQPFSGFCGEPTRTPSRTLTFTPTPTGSESSTPTPSSTPTATPSGRAPQIVMISEVAWAGTTASPADEWIELRNPGSAAVDLSGWTLTDGNDIEINLSGMIGSGEFYLLERSDNETISDIGADGVYSGALSNGGDVLFVIDPSGVVVDTANGDGGAWPAGASAPAALSMERISDGPESNFSWCTNDGVHRNGRDAAGNPIRGTPRAAFSGYCHEETPTPTATPTVLQTPFPAYAVVINEVAWAGTQADSNDEWIELWNPGSEPISLSGWVLTDGDDMQITLEGSIAPGEFFLLERGGDDTVSDTPAQELYTGSLSNSGEELRLLDPTGNVIDTAGGHPWPAGTASPGYASMERRGIDPPGWSTNTGWVLNGRDTAGNPIRGTPGRANSALFPTPTSTPLPKGILINEFLPKPGSDWNRDGSIDYFDEFIELLNTTSDAVDIGGWMVDDVMNGGSRPFHIPAGTWIQAGQFLVFFRSQTRIALNDNGDEVWLLAPDGTRVNGQVYTRTRWPDSGWDRFPDGFGVLRLGFPPTPGEANRLPEDILHPKKEPLPVIEGGWRRVACGREAEPLLVGDGFLTVGGEDSIRTAESSGWFIWWNGQCFAWSAPFLGRRFPYSNLRLDADSAQMSAGWWWEAWFLR